MKEIKRNLTDCSVWLAMFFLGICYMLAIGLQYLASVRVLIGIVIAYVTYPYISKIFW